MSAESRIQELGLTLPPSVPPGGIYKPLVITGNIGYLSGHGPYLGDDKYITGRVGEDLTLDEGQEAARQVGLAILRTMKDQLGDLNKVGRIVKVLALVNSADNFHQQPQVINGFSELMKEVFGEDRGIGARSAIATNTLPGNIAVEIELIFELAE
ncbi:RidA family protein [Verrucomicrobiales bacterium]|nr:RidA family protein [Verrucomicrobiales bacterium]MDB4721840.1 RidA family protein [Verrucomicrobiales bacterium]MDC0048020.1 RidA family protein [Verrucomicrobiota bacterium]NCG26925.1 RidA family protein [Verrucomicrobiales bacterium]